MKYTIEPQDFDEAVKQPWDTKTCVAAQSAKRYDMLGAEGEIKQDGNGNYIAPFSQKETTACGRVMRIFDKHFRGPGDETKPELVALRASLPIEINLP